MALNPQDKTQKKISLPAAGNIPARLVRIIELGEHDGRYGVKDQIQLWYTLSTRIISDEGEYQGKQHMVRTQYLTKSSNEKAALMDHVRVLAPAATSLGEMLNQPCYLQIEHNVTDKGTFANIVGISSVPEGMTVGEADTAPFYFDWDNPDPQVWEKNLWDGVKEKIQSAVNYKGSVVERMVLELENK